MDEVELIYSEHCQSVTKDNQTVLLEIYCTDRTEWSLEVVDENNNSTVWDELFKSDDEAYKKFQRTLEDEGISSMIGHAQ